MKVEITFKNLPKEFKNWYIGEVRSKRKDCNKFSDDVVLKILSRHPKEILFTYVRKWLREIHNLHIEVTPSFKAYYVKYGSIEDMLLQELEILNGISIKFKTYEEALESGLHELLKLTKNKQ